MPVSPARRRRLRRAGAAVLGVVLGVVLALVATACSGGDADPADSASTSYVLTPYPASTAPVTGSSTSSVAVTPTSVPVAPRPPRSGVTFGSALYGLNPGRLTRALDAVVDLHMSWIRIDLSWAAVQPISRERYQWGDVDAVVTAARARHLNVLGLIGYTPGWARTSGCTSFACPPRSPADFAAFAAVTARRLVPRGVVTYQVWNEPNIAAFWRSPNAAAYQRLLAATSAALRDVSGRVRVLFGGLAFVGDAAAAEVSGDLDAARFVRSACTRRQCDVDAVGYDPYTFPRLPSDPGAPLNAWQRLVNPAAGAGNLRTALRAAGLGRTPVWITAFGAPTSYRGSSNRALVGEARQAAILTDGAGVVGANRGTVGAYFVNTLDDSAAAGPVGGHFGLVRTDGTRKPAFAALARALR